MRIAQVAPLAESVPPALYGGTERVVSWLTEELVGLGHDVTLFASGDSKTAARLVPVVPRSLRLNRQAQDASAAYALLLEEVAARADEFDIIHSHIDWIHLPLFVRLGVPFLTTLHGRLDLGNLQALVQSFARAHFVSISDSQRKPLPDLNWTATIHHGLPTDGLRPSFREGKYLAFLGRIAPEKGPDVAIRIARTADMPLKIAAKLPRGHTRFFKERIEPLLDGGNVEFVGEVNEREKQTFLGNAAALLFPIDWPEPFGLVMIEAMACGTPVIAWRRGSVPEVIEHGVNGFIVDDEEQALKVVPMAIRLDRSRVRQEFENRFTATRMAQDYVRCFSELAAKPTRHRPHKRLSRAVVPPKAGARRAGPAQVTPKAELASD